MNTKQNTIDTSTSVSHVLALRSHCSNSTTETSFELKITTLITALNNIVQQDHNFSLNRFLARYIFRIKKSFKIYRWPSTASYIRSLSYNEGNSDTEKSDSTWWTMVE